MMKRPAAKAPAPAPKRRPEPEPEEEEEDEEDGEDAQEDGEEEEEGEGDEEEDDAGEAEVEAAPAPRPRASVASSPNRRKWGKASLTAHAAAASSAPADAATAARSAASSPGAASEASRGALRVDYASHGGPPPLSQGLAALRRAAKLCDAVVVHRAGRLPAHRAVVAAQSEVLAARMEAAPELDCGSVSAEAADCLVRWAYGEVDEASYRPSSEEVNTEVLSLASDFALPQLQELCACQLVASAATTNVAERIALCERFALPALRAALVAAIVQDPAALAAVASDPLTLGHPALMRELLGWVATSGQGAKRPGA